MLIMDDLRRQIEELLVRVVGLETRNAGLETCNAQLEARNAELERQLQRRGKKYTPKANAKKTGGNKIDRRRQPQRQRGDGFRFAIRLNSDLEVVSAISC